jgi:hypothetical protein
VLHRDNTRAYILLLVFAIPVPVIWLSHHFDVNRMLGFEAVALAVAAVLIAILHATKLEGVAEDLHDVSRSLPTRTVGVFPSYLPAVVELVGRATKSLTIICDTPAHGAFSNTDAFAEYWTTIRHLMVDGDVSIKCAFFDSAGREALHRAQIGEDFDSWDSRSDKWDAWKKRNVANCVAFDRLARDRGKALGLQVPERDGGPTATWADTPKDYVTSMMAINEAVLASLDSSTKVEELPFTDPLREGPSMYFWLRDDDQEAVFVIVPVRGIGVEYLAGFHTREPGLIRALGTVYAHREEGR